MTDFSEFNASRRSLLTSVLTVPILSSCGRMASKGYQYRYILGLNVNTPNGILRSSSIIEINVTNISVGVPGPEASGARLSVYGEAVGIELRPGKFLFALLSDQFGFPYASSMPGDAHKNAFQNYRNDIEGSFNFLNSVDRILEVPRFVPDNRLNGTSGTAWPPFVTFADINDPRTANIVDAPDISRWFGEGFSVSGIYIKRTNMGMKYRLDNILPWLPLYKNKNFNGQRDKINDGNILSHMSSSNFQIKKI